MLEARHLARGTALAPLGLGLAPGVTGLVGPNGAGKTTLIRALAGLTRGPGTVRWHGRPLTPRDFAYMPAEREVAWALPAREVVALATPDRALVADAMARTATTMFAERPVTRLSTGERARVLLARAIAARPPLLLLDEPTANLDPAHALAILALLRDEAAQGTTILVALHDLAAARRWCDRLLLLDRGRVVAHGPPQAVLTAHHLAATFGVRAGPDGWEPA